MVISTRTIFPIAGVIKHGGSVSFAELASELMDLDPRRFGNEDVVMGAIGEYCSCLAIENGTVTFNTKARSYTGNPFMEREAQAFLHRHFPEQMKRFQLYPLRTRSNSPKCHLGIPWTEIPLDQSEKDLGYNHSCDFRVDGHDSCCAQCMVGEATLKKYGIGPADGT